jgi:glycine C-acetyltransferase
MYKSLQPGLQKQLQQIKEQNLLKKNESSRPQQGAVIQTTDGREVINFCANNYLGLSAHPRVIEAAKKAIDTHGYGMSSVRFICGTQDIHKELEGKISEFLKLRIPFSTRPPLTPTAECLNRCLEAKMPLSLTN